MIIAVIVQFKGAQSVLGPRLPRNKISHFEKRSPQPVINVHLEFRFNLPSFLLDFQSFTEKPVFGCPFSHPMILILSYLVKNSIYRVPLYAD